MKVEDLHLVAFGQRGSIAGITHYEVQYQGSLIGKVWKGREWGKWKFQVCGRLTSSPGWYSSRKAVIAALLKAYQDEYRPDEPRFPGRGRA